VVHTVPCEPKLRTLHRLSYLTWVCLNTPPPFLFLSSFYDLPNKGMYLSDLIFIDDGNKDFIDQRLINIEKCEQMGDVISEIQQWQNSHYCLEEVPVIKDYLSQQLDINDQEVYRISCQMEPREGGPDDPTSLPLRKVNAMSPNSKPSKPGALNNNNTTASAIGDDLTNPTRNSLPVGGTPYSSFFDTISRISQEGDKEGDSPNNRAHRRTDITRTNPFEQPGPPPDEPLPTPPGYQDPTTTYTPTPTEPPPSFLATKPGSGIHRDSISTTPRSPPVERREGDLTASLGGSGGPAAVPLQDPRRTPKPLQAVMSPKSLKTWTSESSINIPGSADPQDHRAKRLSSPGLVPVSPSQAQLGGSGGVVSQLERDILSRPSNTRPWRSTTIGAYKYIVCFAYIIFIYIIYSFF